MTSQQKDPVAKGTGSLLRIRLGLALQRHRLGRGLTQAELAEFVDLSLKYIGEIERGEANTTMAVLERLADAVGWDPINTLLREPITEGVRTLLLTEHEGMLDTVRSNIRWLRALEPAQAQPLTAGPSAPAGRAPYTGPRASKTRGAR